MKNAIIATAILGALGFGAPPARSAGVPAPPVPAAISTAAACAGVAASTAATVACVYTVDRMRDPFARWGSSRGPARPFTMEDFSIHKLSLRAIMKDGASDFALFVDNEAGLSFLLRKGRLYDPKRKAAPGIAGSINIKEKTVTLTATDGDVQIFRLGEEEKD